MDMLPLVVFGEAVWALLARAKKPPRPGSIWRGVGSWGGATLDPVSQREFHGTGAGAGLVGGCGDRVGGSGSVGSLSVRTLDTGWQARDTSHDVCAQGVRTRGHRRSRCAGGGRCG